MRPVLKLYIGLFAVLTFLTAVSDLRASSEREWMPEQLLLLVALTFFCIMGEHITFQVHPGWIMAAGTVPQIAAAFLLPPFSAEAAAAIGVIAYHLTHRRALSKVIFNVSSVSLSVGVAAHLVQGFGGAALLAGAGGLVGPIVAITATILYHLVSSFSVAGVVALDQRRPFWEVVRGKLGLSALAEIALGLLGATLACLQAIAPMWLPALLPTGLLLFLAWLTMDRAERRSRNLALTSAVGRGVSGTPNHDVVFRAITGLNVRDTLRLDGLALLPLREPPDFEPTVAGSVTIHPLSLEVLERIRSEGRRAALTNRDASVGSTLALGERHVAAGGVPFGPNGSPPFGALIGWRVSPGARGASFSTEEMLVLTTLADYATVALETERLLKESSNAEALRELAQLKDEFLSQVSHELRTPLTIIYGFSELLVKNRLSGTAVRDSVEQIYDSAKVMLRLVEDLLDTARVESGRLSLRREVTDLGPWLVRLADSFAAAHSSHQFATEVAAPLPRCNVDLERFAQVMHNLLSNAVRYSPEASTITVQARALPKGVGLEVRVVDQGVGIPPEDLSRVFEKFYRGEQGAALASRGAGIGLAVARALVEAHHGEIGVESQPGKGSTFWIRLPASLAATQMELDDTSAVSTSEVPALLSLTQ